VDSDDASVKDAGEECGRVDGEGNFGEDVAVDGEDGSGEVGFVAFGEADAVGVGTVDDDADAALGAREDFGAGGDLERRHVNRLAGRGSRIREAKDTGLTNVIEGIESQVSSDGGGGPDGR
jgi:hypothetical protein